MEYGWSVILQDYVHATEINYGDCETFAIMCANPDCREYVHKVGSEITKRQYLAHYPKQGHVDCELRVRQVIREHLKERAFIYVPHGQELMGFMLRFENIVLEPFRDGTPEGQRLIRDLNTARRRVIWQRMVRELLPHIRKICRGEDAPHYADFPTWDKETPAWRQGLRDVLTFLTAGNSGHATLFAATYGLALRAC
jgi:hypothetical protein